MDLLETLFQMVVVHAVLDFMWQPDAMARGKNRHSTLHERPGFPQWYYWLSSHALAHGGGVYLVTGSLELALVEVLLHTIIDYAKCEDWTTLAQDQSLHISCKLVYCFFLV